eukprot:TRINITY_DN7464_c0_g1_i1.p1 TRINITY_DN7464_c0_g1~~TRINITY_DN7464_c0_g1_i1.p1  ORF type:complete len:3554 (-),score=564.91 TRINITY_DN7464_c0_g1_i1:189-10850(-)
MPRAKPYLSLSKYLKEPPPLQKELIARLLECDLQQLPAIIEAVPDLQQRFLTTTKGDFTHWADVVQRCDEYFTKYREQNKHLEFQDVSGKPFFVPALRREAISIFTLLTCILEHCKVKGGLCSLECLRPFLNSPDPEVVFHTLDVLRQLAWHKPHRSMVEIHNTKDMLLALAGGWGAQPSLHDCCSCQEIKAEEAAGCNSLRLEFFLPEDTQLSSEFVRRTSPDMCETVIPDIVAAAQSLQPTDSDTQAGLLELLRTVVPNLPSNCVYPFWLRCRLGGTFLVREGASQQRLWWCRVRLTALSVLGLMQANISSFFHYNSQLGTQISALLHDLSLPPELHASCMWVLPALIHEEFLGDAQGVELLSSIGVSSPQGALFPLLAHLTERLKEIKSGTGMSPALHRMLESVIAFLMVGPPSLVDQYPQVVAVASAGLTTLLSLIRARPRGSESLLCSSLTLLEHLTELPTFRQHVVDAGTLEVSIGLLSEEIASVHGSGVLNCAKEAVMQRALQVIATLISTNLSGVRPKQVLLVEGFMAALRTVIGNVVVFGGAVFSNTAATLVAMMHNDPSILPTLFEEGFAEKIFEVVRSPPPDARTVLCLPSLIVGLCINGKGLEEVRQINPAARFGRLLIDPKYSDVIDPDTAQVLGNELNEMHRHVAPLREFLVPAMLEMLRDLGRLMEQEKPTEAAEAEKEQQRRQKILAVALKALEHWIRGAGDEIRIFIHEGGLKELISLSSKVAQVAETRPGAPVNAHIPSLLEVLRVIVGGSASLGGKVLEKINDAISSELKGLQGLTADAPLTIAARRGLRAVSSLMVLYASLFQATPNALQEWCKFKGKEVMNAMVTIDLILRQRISKASWKERQDEYTRDKAKLLAKLEPSQQSETAPTGDVEMEQAEQATKKEAEEPVKDTEIDDVKGYATACRAVLENICKGLFGSGRREVDYSSEAPQKPAKETSVELARVCIRYLESFRKSFSEAPSDDEVVQHCVLLEGLLNYTHGMHFFLFDERRKTCNTLVLQAFHRTKGVETLLLVFRDVLTAILDRGLHTQALRREEELEQLRTRVKEIEQQKGEPAGEATATTKPAATASVEAKSSSTPKDSKQKRERWATVPEKPLVSLLQLLLRLVNAQLILESPMTASLFVEHNFSPAEFVREMQAKIAEALNGIKAHPQLHTLSEEVVNKMVEAVVRTLSDYLKDKAKATEQDSSAAQASRDAARPKPAFEPAEDSIQQLMEMGFTRSMVVRALQALSANNVPMAADWIINHMEELLEADEAAAAPPQAAAGATLEALAEEGVDEEELLRRAIEMSLLGEAQAEQPPALPPAAAAAETPAPALAAPVTPAAPEEELARECGEWAMGFVDASQKFEYPCADLLNVVCQQDEKAARDTISRVAGRAQIAARADSAFNQRVWIKELYLLLSQSGNAKYRDEIARQFELIPLLAHHVRRIASHPALQEDKDTEQPVVLESLEWSVKLLEVLVVTKNAAADEEAPSWRKVLKCGPAAVLPPEAPEILTTCLDLVDRCQLDETHLSQILSLIIRLTRTSHPLALQVLDSGCLAKFIQLTNVDQTLLSSLLRAIIEDPHFVQQSLEAQLRKSIGRYTLDRGVSVPGEAVFFVKGAASQTPEASGTSAATKPDSPHGSVSPVPGASPQLPPATPVVAPDDTKGRLPALAHAPDRRPVVRLAFLLKEFEAQRTKDPALFINAFLAACVLVVHKSGNKVEYGVELRPINAALPLNFPVKVQPLQRKVKPLDEIMNMLQNAFCERCEAHLYALSQSKPLPTAPASTLATVKPLAGILQVLTELVSHYPQCGSSMTKPDPKRNVLQLVAKHLLPYVAPSTPHGSELSALASLSQRFLVALLSRHAIKVIADLNQVLGSGEGMSMGALHAFANLIHSLLLHLSNKRQDSKAKTEQIVRQMVKCGLVGSFCSCLRNIDLNHPEAAEVVGALLKCLELFSRASTGPTSDITLDLRAGQDHDQPLFSPDSNIAMDTDASLANTRVEVVIETNAAEAPAESSASTSEEGEEHFHEQEVHEDEEESGDEHEEHGDEEGEEEDAEEEGEVVPREYIGGEIVAGGAAEDEDGDEDEFGFEDGGIADELRLFGGAAQAANDPAHPFALGLNNASAGADMRMHVEQLLSHYGMALVPELMGSRGDGSDGHSWLERADFRWQEGVASPQSGARPASPGTYRPISLQQPQAHSSRQANSAQLDRSWDVARPGRFTFDLFGGSGRFATLIRRPNTSGATPAPEAELSNTGEALQQLLAEFAPDSVVEAEIDTESRPPTTGTSPYVGGGAGDSLESIVNRLSMLHQLDREGSSPGAGSPQAPALGGSEGSQAGNSWSALLASVTGGASPQQLPPSLSGLQASPQLPEVASPESAAASPIPVPPEPAVEAAPTLAQPAAEVQTESQPEPAPTVPVASPALPDPATAEPTALPAPPAAAEPRAVDDTLDPTFLAALPPELRSEVLANQMAQLMTHPPDPTTGSTIDPQFLGALPADIREEVLQQERRMQEDQRRALQQQQQQAAPVATGPPPTAAEMDTGSFLATLTPELRQEILMTSDDAFLATLPPEMASEAYALRERALMRHARRATGAGRGGAGRGESLLDIVGGRGSFAGLANSLGLGAPPVPGANFRTRYITGHRLERPPGRLGERDRLWGVEESSEVQAQAKPVIPEEALPVLTRLFFLAQFPSKALLHRILASLCKTEKGSAVVVSTLVNLLTQQQPGQEAVLAETTLPSRLYGLPPFMPLLPATPPKATIPPLVSSRALECLQFLAKHNASVLRLLAAPTVGPSAKPERYLPRLFSLVPHCSKNDIAGQLVQLIDVATQWIVDEVMHERMARQKKDKEAEVKPEPTSGTEAVAPTTEPPLSPSANPVAVPQTPDNAVTVEEKPPVEPYYREMFCDPALLAALVKVLDVASAQAHAINVLKNMCVFCAEETKTAMLTHLQSSILQAAQRVAGHIQLCTERLHSLRLKEQQRLAELEATGKRSETTVGVLEVGATDVPSSGAEVLLQQLLRTYVEVAAENSQANTVGPDFVSSTSFLWEALSQYLGVIGEQLESLRGAKKGSTISVPPVVMPLVESFFTFRAISAERPRPDQPSRSASPIPENSAETREPTTPTSRREERRDDPVHLFIQRNRKLLNAIVASNPQLLSTALSELMKYPRFVDFENKRLWFREQIRREQDQQSYASCRLAVRRDQIFQDSFFALGHRSPEEMKGRLRVTFKREEGVDAGGLTREWFQVLSKEMFNPNYALFVHSAEGQTYQPNRLSDINPEHLNYFQFAGRVIAMAVYNDITLDAYFTRSLYKHLLGITPEVQDIESIDPNYYKNLQWMLSNDITGVVEETFSAETERFSKREIIDLIPNGRNISVTNENKEEYVRLITEFKMTTDIKKQIDHFIGGFYDIIPRKLISIFTEQELELLICGLADIDVDDLKANTEYVGYTASSPPVVWLWQTVESMTQEERSLFIQFVTGCSKVPLGGFSELQGMHGRQKFNIHRTADNTRLPCAHTCFNQLDLPDYPSFEVTKDRLMKAVSMGAFGFSFV